MRVFIDSHCTGCMLCSKTCPEAFAIRSNGKAQPVDENRECVAVDTWQQALAECPASAIMVLEGSWK